MKNNKTIVARVLGIVCALLMLAVVVFQFLPAWQLDEESMSIAEYTWFPYETSKWHPNNYNDFNKFFRAELEDDLVSAGDIAGGHALILICSLFGAVLCAVRGTKKLSYIVGAVAGLIGVWEYMMQPLYVLTPLGMPLLILSAAVTVVSIAGFVLTYVNKKN